MGWFHVVSAPPTVELAIFSSAPSCSFSVLPWILRILPSAQRANPILRKRQVARQHNGDIKENITYREPQLVH